MRQKSLKSFLKEDVTVKKLCIWVASCYLLSTAHRQGIHSYLGGFGAVANIVSFFDEDIANAYAKEAVNIVSWTEWWCCPCAPSVRAHHLRYCCGNRWRWRVYRVHPFIARVWQSNALPYARKLGISSEQNPHVVYNNIISRFGNRGKGKEFAANGVRSSVNAKGGFIILLAEI